MRSATKNLRGANEVQHRENVRKAGGNFEKENESITCNVPALWQCLNLKKKAKSLNENGALAKNALGSLRKMFKMAEKIQKLWIFAKAAHA
jgi:hypothetical protein